MKKIISILLLSTFTVSSIFAQRNYAQELIDLLQQGKCFEARDLYAQYADNLPLSDKTYGLVYKSHMALFFNKLDSAIIYLEDLTTNHELQLGPAVGLYYGKLLQVYEDTQQFEKGMKLCDRIIAYFQRNPFDLASDLVKNEIHQMENVKSSFKKRNVNELRRRVERIRNKNAIIKLKDSEYIRFDAVYNNVPIQTWFNTGVSTYLVTTKQVAEEIGVRIIDTTQDSMKIINGVPVKALAGIIDSIDLKSVKLYNIPVMVHESLFPQLRDTLNREAELNRKMVQADRMIIMGLPTMKLIRKIEFDWEKRTVCFPESTEESVINSFPNIFMNENNLYQRLKINGLNYVGHVDTGDNDFVNMTFSFYEKNKSHIEIDSVIEKEPMTHYRETGVFYNVPYEIVKNPKVYFNGKNVNSSTRNVFISDGTLFHLNIFDGTIGANFFKNSGSKVIFDFDNMEIKNEN